MDINGFIGSFESLSKASKFRVEMSGVPLAVVNNQKLSFHCQATTVPSMTTGVIEQSYQGRKVKLKGDRTYEEWTFTIIIDNTWELYNQLFNWNKIDNTATGAPAQTLAYSDTIADARILALNENNEVTNTWELKGCWPSSIGNVEYAWDSNDTIQTCAITLQFNSFDIVT